MFFKYLLNHSFQKIKFTLIDSLSFDKSRESYFTKEHFAIKLYRPHHAADDLAKIQMTRAKYAIIEHHRSKDIAGMWGPKALNSKPITRESVHKDVDLLCHYVNANLLY